MINVSLKPAQNDLYFEWVTFILGKENSFEVVQACKVLNWNYVKNMIYLW